MPLEFLKVLPGEKLKIVITQGVRVNDTPAQPGDVMDVSVFDGRYLIGSDRAKLYVEPPKPVEPEIVEVEKKAEEVAPAKVPAPAPKAADQNSKKTETKK